MPTRPTGVTEAAERAHHNVADNQSPANARILSLEQTRRLARAHLDIRVPSHVDPLTVVVRRVAAILDTKVAALTWVRGAWSLAAESVSDPPELPAALSLPSPTPSADPDASHDPGVFQHADWTFVWCRAAGARPRMLAPTLLALSGEWTLPPAVLQALAQSVSLGTAALQMARRAQQRVIVHRMSRLLAKASGLPSVSQIIVDYMARAVGARMAALAVPDVTQRRLSIVASHGYALALVDELRIESGVGVLGQVFEHARVIHAPGGHEFGRRPPRPRYRTDSFVAVPLLGRQQVVGVVSVTDRIDDQPFTRADVSALRALAAPAALVLERERAVLDAEAYAHAAAIDPVSGAFNRRYFHVRLDEELERSRRHNMPVALLMIDIDDFKAINDAFGHLAGDTIIKDVADILRRSVRVFDVCSRFGGEEFAIVMPGSGADSAQKIAERIRERIESYRPQDSMLATSRITVSIGLATSAMTMGGRELVERADRALYMAKSAGKNQVCTIGPNESIRPLSRE